MRRLFRSLLAELHKLGCRVIAADFGAVTICTGKRDPAAAAAFVEGVQASLRSREAFTWLELTPVRRPRLPRRCPLLPVAGAVC